MCTAALLRAADAMVNSLRCSLHCFSSTVCAATDCTSFSWSTIDDYLTRPAALKHVCYVQFREQYTAVKRRACAAERYIGEPIDAERARHYNVVERRAVDCVPLISGAIPSGVGDNDARRKHDQVILALLTPFRPRQRPLVWRHQVPLTLGFALTDQKSQGQTLDDVIYLMLDKTNTYVPLSRPRQRQRLLIVQSGRITADQVNCVVSPILLENMKQCDQREQQTLQHVRSQTSEQLVLALPTPPPIVTSQQEAQIAAHAANNRSSSSNNARKRRAATEASDQNPRARGRPRTAKAGPSTRSISRNRSKKRQ